MTYKTIVVHCDATKKVGHRLGVAAELANRFGATLVAVHPRPPMEIPAFDASVNTAPLLDAYEKAAAADQSTARDAFNTAVKGKHLPVEWRVVEGFPDEVLAVNARYADLLVIGQTDIDDIGPIQGDLPETVAIETGKPVLVVPHIGAAETLGKTVLLCWNASRESALAATDALPFLKAAEKVVVLIVDPHRSAAGHGAEPGADVATWLARHGVNVTVQRESAADTDIGNVILSRAADYGADLIVMGIYGHSRMRELIMGGASRTLLNSMTVPVLMAH